MTDCRVAVTGIGAVSALGNDRDTFWHRLCAGESGIGEITGVDLSRLGFRHGAMVDGWAPEALFEKRTRELLDRFSLFGVAAAREAAAAAGITWDAALRCKTAVVTGSCVGGQGSEDREFLKLYQENARRLHPFTVPRVMANAPASAIALEMGLTGPSFTLSTACASASHAIGHAFWLVRSGVAALALAGGSEAPFSLGHLKAWEAMRVVAPDTCRPFSLQRRGMILGEGAAMLVLEPLAAARARGAEVHAEIVGFGMSTDAHHMTRPTAEGPRQAMSGALRDASISAEEIDYINAHGTGTPTNDVVEAEAIRQLFGAHAESLAVSSTKSMHGHALGAAGALEAAATVLAIRDGIAPPTANFIAADPECDLDVVPLSARPMKIDAALSNSFAFGGMNAVLAFRSA